MDLERVISLPVCLFCVLGDNSLTGKKQRFVLYYRTHIHQYQDQRGKRCFTKVSQRQRLCQRMVRLGGALIHVSNSSDVQWKSYLTTLTIDFLPVMKRLSCTTLLT